MKTIKEENDISRISKMVASWKKDGRAFSNINNEDDAFFKAIKMSPMKVGNTSQSGNDILYYNTSLFNSDKDAIRNNRTKMESKRPISRKLESRLRLKIKGIVESILKEDDFVRAGKPNLTRSQKTKQWLKSFLDSTKMEYNMKQDSLILSDDMYYVELKILGGGNIAGE